MANTPYQYKVVPWHGESGSVWYLVQSPAEDPEDWEVVASYPSRDEAVDACPQPIATNPNVTPAFHGKA
jgi:hypothetical protein